MRKLWCQLWNAFLNAFRDAVTVITEAAIQLSRAVITIFTEVVDAIGSSLKSNPLVWAVGIGLLLWFLPKGEDKERSSNSYSGSDQGNQPNIARQEGGNSISSLIDVRNNGGLQSYET